MPRRSYDPAALGSDLSRLLNSVVVPRPIAWLSTRSADGVDDLAPHSFFTVSFGTVSSRRRIPYAEVST